MLKSAVEALGSGVRLLDVVALVVAFPVATRFEEWLARRSGASSETVAAALVLAVVLLATSAWVHLLLARNVQRPAWLDIGRPVRGFATGALLVIAIAFAMEQQADSRLLLGVYAAVALALALGARLGWRAVAVASVRDGRAALGRERVRPARSARHRDGDARPEPAASAAPAWAGATPAARPPPAGAPTLSLEGLRSCMDEVAYTPGSPNVLSMTKYLHAPAAGGAGRPEEAAAADDEPAVHVARRDDGAETVLRIAGVLDALTVPDVRAAFEGLLAERRTSLTLDLASLRIIDSSGVGLVVSLFKRCRALGGEVRVSGVRDQPLAVFRLLRLDRIFSLQ